MATRSTHWAVLGFLTMCLCMVSCAVKVNLDHLVKGDLRPTSLQVVGPVAPLALLWFCSQSLETVLGDRVPAALIFAIALPLVLFLVLPI